LVSHLDRTAVELLTRESCRDFFNDGVEVDLTCGRGYPPMRLLVHEFIPVSETISRVPALTEWKTFELHYPYPVALDEAAMRGLVDECRNHVKYIVSRPLDLTVEMPRNMPPISKRVLEAVSHYHCSLSGTSHEERVDSLRTRARRLADTSRKLF
jgi:hypothetical protein